MSEAFEGERWEWFEREYRCPNGHAWLFSTQLAEGPWPDPTSRPATAPDHTP